MLRIYAVEGAGFNYLILAVSTTAHGFDVDERLGKVSQSSAHVLNCAYRGYYYHGVWYWGVSWLGLADYIVPSPCLLDIPHPFFGPCLTSRQFQSLPMAGSLEH